MIGISIAIYLAIFIYIIFKRSELTLFLLSLIFSMVYFYPILFGYTTVMDRNYEYINIPIKDEVYYIYWSILFLLFLSDLLYCKVKKKPVTLGVKFKEFNVKHYMNAMFLITNLLFFYYLVKLNIRFFDNKVYIADMLGQLFLVFQTLVMVYFISAIVLKNKAGFIFSSIFLMWMLIIGFRTPIVITFIGLMIVKFVTGNGIKFVKYIIPGLLAGLLVFVSKPFYTEYSYTKNLFSSFVNTFFNIDTYISELKFSEPFVTQSILNLTVSNGFEVDASYMSRWFSRLVSGTSKLSESPDFHGQFVERFLPGIDYGVAFNIWAEFYAVGGYFMLAAFILVYLVVLLIMQNILVQSKGIMKVCFAVVAAYWTFYLHRNNFENMILYTQVTLIPILLLYLSTHILTRKSKIRNI